MSSGSGAGDTSITSTSSMHKTVSVFSCVSIILICIESF